MAEGNDIERTGSQDQKNDFDMSENVDQMKKVAIKKLEGEIKELEELVDKAHREMMSASRTANASFTVKPGSQFRLLPTDYQKAIAPAESASWGHTKQIRQKELDEKLRELEILKKDNKDI